MSGYPLRNAQPGQDADSFFFMRQAYGNRYSLLKTMGRSLGSPHPHSFSLRSFPDLLHREGETALDQLEGMAQFPDFAAVASYIDVLTDIPLADSDRDIGDVL